MIVKRIEIILSGPDEYPEIDDGLAGFEFDEIDARNLLDQHLLYLQAEMERALPRQFQLEVLGHREPGAPAPSGAPGCR